MVTPCGLLVSVPTNNGEAASLAGVKYSYCDQQFYASALQPIHPSLLYPDPRPLRSNTPALVLPNPQRPASHRWRSQRSYCHLRGRHEEGSYPLVRRLLRSLMVGEIRLFSGTHQGSLPLSTRGPSRTAATMVLEDNPFPASLQLLGNAPILPSVCWADEHTCSDCHAADHTVVM